MRNQGVVERFSCSVTLGQKLVETLLVRTEHPRSRRKGLGVNG